MSVRWALNTAGSDWCTFDLRSNNFTKCRKEQKTFEEALAVAKEAK